MTDENPGKLTTHVLDTEHGKPAAGMLLHLFKINSDGSKTLIRDAQTNNDGRVDSPLLSGDQMQEGKYRLEFEVAAFFRKTGDVLPETPFLDVVALEFGIPDAKQKYHVPLLCTPWTYSTYRGS